MKTSKQGSMIRVLKIELAQTIDTIKDLSDFYEMYMDEEMNKKAETILQSISLLKGHQYELESALDDLSQEVE